MRITLDTTILVRAHDAAHGLARALLLELLAGCHQLILSAWILEELEQVLHYPRLLRATGLLPGQITQYLEFLSLSSQLVETDDTFPVPIRDPNDVPVIRTAVAGKAEALSTLDAHFFEPAIVTFCEARGIRILKDVELLHLIRRA